MWKSNMSYDAKFLEKATCARKRFFFEIGVILTISIAL